MNNFNFQKVTKILNKNLDRHEVVKYEIIESFQKNGERTYQLHNLAAEVEDDMLFFKDIEEILPTDISYVLNGFLVSSVKDLIIGENIIKIYFKDGHIIIKAII